MSNGEKIIKANGIELCCPRADQLRPRPRGRLPALRRGRRRRVRGGDCFLRSARRMTVGAVREPDPHVAYTPLCQAEVRHPDGRIVWTEVHPERCPGCRRPYRGGHVAVGWLACGCDNTLSHGGTGHRPCTAATAASRCSCRRMSRSKVRLTSVGDCTADWL